MLKNAPTLAIGGVHTAENEPPRIFIISFHCFNPFRTPNTAPQARRGERKETSKEDGDESSRTEVGQYFFSRVLRECFLQLEEFRKGTETIPNTLRESWCRNGWDSLMKLRDLRLLRVILHVFHCLFAYAMMSAGVACLSMSTTLS